MSAKKLTGRQTAFCLSYLEVNNACEAYRRSYRATNMKSRTIEKRAAELIKAPAVAQRIAELRGLAAKEAVLDRAWVISRLMANARRALGEEKVKLSVQRTNKTTGEITVSEIEVTERDAAAANRALELLGKADEVRLFTEQPPNPNQETPVEKPRDTGRDHLLRLSQRYASGLKLIEGGAAHPVGDGPRRLSTRD